MFKFFHILYNRYYLCEKIPASNERTKGHAYEMIKHNYSKVVTKCKYCGRKRTLYY